MNIENNQISRRGFLKNSIFLVSVANPLTEAVFSIVRDKPESNKFSGFIVSDIHFGWDSPKQPDSNIIKKNLKKILEKFPNLDILIDTGDAYHNTSSESYLAEWVKVISEGCSTVPLMYVPGNHEISHNNKFNSETLACRMGSIPARPYYSLTIKGIHLISLPQLMGANYISNEVLEWVKLDLNVHKSYTTLIFSHNSLKGTTCPHDDTGYRTIANSDKVIALLREHPQVIAWCHGHNHTWEIVERWQKVFVSNGRFGGFPPKEMFGGERLGGIYFEVDKEGLIIRAWNCDEEKFFDELNASYAKLRYELNVPTSYNPDEPSSVAYGVGLSRDGQKIPIYRHYIGSELNAKVYFMGVDDKSFNENNDFTAYGERPTGGKMLPAMEITEIRAKDKDQWKWTNPGILLTPVSGCAGIISPRRGDAKHCYYPTAPGKKYKAYLRAKAYSQDTTVSIVWRIHRSDGTLIVETRSEDILLKEDYNEITSSFQVPPISVNNIYNNEESDYQILLSAECSFKNTGEGVRVELWQIQPDTTEVYSKNPAIQIGDKMFSYNGVLKGGEYSSVDINLPNISRFVVTTKVQGSGLITYLIEEKGIEFQIRNSVGWQNASEIHISSPRANFANYLPATVLAPLTGHKTQYFISKVWNVDFIEELKKSSEEYAFKVKGSRPTQIEMEIFTPNKPSTVDGVINWDYKPNLLKLVCPSDATVRISWA